MPDVLKRDQNRVTVGAGANTSDNVSPKMISVDASTDRLLISVANLSPGSATGGSVAKRDQNRTTVVMGVDSTGALKQIATDENGYLICDLTM